MSGYRNMSETEQILLGELSISGNGLLAPQTVSGQYMVADHLSFFSETLLARPSPWSADQRTIITDREQSLELDIDITTAISADYRLHAAIMCKTHGPASRCPNRQRIFEEEYPGTTSEVATAVGAKGEDKKEFPLQTCDQAATNRGLIASSLRHIRLEDPRPGNYNITKPV